MSQYRVLDSQLISVANAIRQKGSTSGSLVWPTGFVNAINAINLQTDVSDTTATAGDVLAGKYFYVSSGVKTEGTIPIKSSLDVSIQNLTVNIPAGYYASSVSSTPTDANLISANIKSGSTIFGVSGSSTVVDVSDTTSVAANVLTGTYFYAVNGIKTQGSLVIQHYYTGNDEPSSSLGADGDIYLMS